jgi:hypothetical protein
MSYQSPSPTAAEENYHGLGYCQPVALTSMIGQLVRTWLSPFNVPAGLKFFLF